MLKAGRIQWLLFVLSGLLLVPVFLVGGRLFAWIPPSVEAEGNYLASSEHDCTESHRGPSFGGTVTIDTNEVVCSQLTSFGGTVVIKGVVRGDIIVFGGDVNIQGTVNGNINAFAGRVTLQSGSHLHGDVHLYRGDFVKSDTAQFEGAVIHPTEHLGLGLIFANYDEYSFPFWSILTWAALGWLLTTLLPEHVMFVRTTAEIKTRRSFLIGLLSILLAPPILIVLFALILSIPLAFLLALGLIAAWALGTVAVGWRLGEYIMRKVAPHRNTRTLQVVVGLTVLALVGSLPFIGGLITVGVGLLGLGAVFLSRFGTRLYSPPKHPITL